MMNLNLLSLVNPEIDLRHGLIGGFARRNRVADEAVCEAMRKLDQQIRRERAIDRRYSQLTRRFKEMLATEAFVATDVELHPYRMDYATFFVLEQATWSLYGDEDRYILKSDYSGHACEKVIAGGRVYLFVADEVEHPTFNGEFMSYERIIESGMNPRGFMLVFDVQRLEELGYDPKHFGSATAFKVLNKRSGNQRAILPNEMPICESLKKSVQEAIDKCENTVKFSELDKAAGNEDDGELY